MVPIIGRHGTFPCCVKSWRGWEQKYMFGSLTDFSALWLWSGPFLFIQPRLRLKATKSSERLLQSLVYIVNILYIQLSRLLYMCLEVHGFTGRIRGEGTSCLHQVELKSSTIVKLFLKCSLLYSCGPLYRVSFHFPLLQLLHMFTYMIEVQPDSHHLLTFSLNCACCVKSCFHFECSQNALCIIWCVHFINM